MKKRILYILILVVISNFTKAQNLASNGSFENYNYCIEGPTGSAPRIIDSIYYWTSPTIGSPDHFNKCSNLSFNNIPNNSTGYQLPRSGYSYGGFVGVSRTSYSKTHYREYLEYQIDTILQANQEYFIRFYISNSGLYYNGNVIATDSLGLLITDTLYNDDSVTIQVNPTLYDTINTFTDTLGWTEVKFRYTATGGEKYFTIGDFMKHEYTYLNTIRIVTMPTNYNNFGEYLYIDDFAIWPVDTVPPVAILRNDTTICSGDSVLLGMEHYSDFTYEWFPSYGLSNDSGYQVWANPLVTTSYILQVTDNIYTKTTDTVNIEVISCALDDTVICMEEPTILGETNYAGWNYQWSPATYLSSTSTGKPICTPLNDVSYQLLTTYPNGDTVYMDSIHIKVGKCYYANAGPDSIICKQDSITIGSHNYSYISYQWSPNYNISNSQQARPTVWPTTSTDYILQVTDTIGNISFDTVSINVKICEGISEALKNDHLYKVSPNPANEFVIVSSTDNNWDEVSILVYNAQGVIVAYKKFQNNCTIDIKSINAGIYFYQIIDNNNNILSKNKLIKL
jgi:hypothetical protein